MQTGSLEAQQQDPGQHFDCNSIRSDFTHIFGPMNKVTSHQAKQSFCKVFGNLMITFHDEYHVGKIEGAENSRPILCKTKVKLMFSKYK
jgi:hypothetical protein